MLLLNILLSIILIGIFAYIVMYNMLVTFKQKVNEAWSDVDVQLRRRHDLIPNIVHTVKGYAKHEKDLLEKVTRERAQALQASRRDLSKLGSIEGELEEDLSTLLMVAEAYPNLKANEHFLMLQDELKQTEDQIASSRRIYNANVTEYNTFINVFPINLVASFAHFHESPFFEFNHPKKVPSVEMK